MILQNNNLIFYYPGNHWVISSRDQISFYFHKINKVEIYTKRDFELLFSTAQSRIFNLLSRHPFLKGVKGNGEMVHIFQSEEVNKNQHSPYFIHQNNFGYLYSFRKSKNGTLHCDYLAEANDTELESENLLHYKLYVDKLNLDLFSNNEQLNKASFELFKRNQKLILNSQLADQLKLKEDNNIDRYVKYIGQHNNILLLQLSIPLEMKEDDIS